MNDQSTLVQVMAWCRQATSHYLSQFWPTSLLPYGLTRPQWVNSLAPWKYGHCHKLMSNLSYKGHQIPYLKCFSSCLAVIFMQSIEARCSVENEDVVGAAPTGDAPTTSLWSTILLPTKVWLILEVWRVTFKLILTHWGRVMHICVGDLNITGSDNGLSPGRRQTIMLEYCQLDL